MVVTISVVTVTYNAGDCLRDTIQSIICQKEKSFEYFVVDGKSSDNTVLIAKEYKDKFKSKGIRYEVVSEPDHGIYDAMNKAAKLVSGDYIIYLNAGDMLVSEMTLCVARRYLSAGNADIVYGDTFLIRNGYEKMAYACAEADLWKKIEFCHQSSFIKREVLLEYMYDTSYEVCADREFFTKCLVEKKKFKHMDVPVSKYLLGGYSSDNGSTKMYLEAAKIQYQYKLVSEVCYGEIIKEIRSRQRFRQMKYKFMGNLFKAIPSLQKFMGWKKVGNK